MRSPAQLRAIFAAYGRRRMPRYPSSPTMGEDENRILEARSRMAKRLQAARKIIRSAKGKLRAKTPLTPGEATAAKESRNLLGAHIRQRGGLVAKARYGRMVKRLGQENVPPPDQWTKPYRPFEGGPSGASKEHKRAMGRARYRVYKDMGLIRTKSGSYE